MAGINSRTMHASCTLSCRISCRLRNFHVQVDKVKTWFFLCLQHVSRLPTSNERIAMSRNIACNFMHVYLNQLCCISRITNQIFKFKMKSQINKSIAWFQQWNFKWNFNILAWWFSSSKSMRWCTLYGHWSLSCSNMAKNFFREGETLNLTNEFLPFCDEDEVIHLSLHINVWISQCMSFPSSDVK